MSMRAVVFKGVGSVQVEDHPIPTIQDPRDAIIKVTVAALCGSDLHWYRGHQKIPVGFIPGHEFAGVIHELGSQVTGLNLGDSVVLNSSQEIPEDMLVLMGDIFPTGYFAASRFLKNVP
ncbi:hypothetical protein CEP53_007609 [Fusarium sp. AF-6]|nr:hypothetical protein CEP53_007609 [Fusarium sp. AF-6]